MPTKWIELAEATHWNTALIPSSFPPVVIGGQYYEIPTVGIKMYENSTKSWQDIGSLPSGRSNVAVAVVYGNAIIVIGGYTKGDSMDNWESSSLTLVEMGQAELLH